MPAKRPGRRKDAIPLPAPHVNTYANLPRRRTHSKCRSICYVLDKLRREFPAGEPNGEHLYAALASSSAETGSYGEFNYLLSNGTRLYARCATNLCYLVRRAPFCEAHLVDQDVTVDFSEVTTPNDRVAVIATQPLTDNETWTVIQPEELLAFHMGEPIRPETVPQHLL